MNSMVQQHSKGSSQLKGTCSRLLAVMCLHLQQAAAHCLSTQPGAAAVTHHQRLLLCAFEG
jgi:hypothetical protein